MALTTPYRHTGLNIGKHKRNIWFHMFAHVSHVEINPNQWQGGLLWYLPKKRVTDASQTHPHTPYSNTLLNIRKHGRNTCFHGLWYIDQNIESLTLAATLSGTPWRMALTRPYTVQCKANIAFHVCCNPWNICKICNSCCSQKSTSERILMPAHISKYWARLPRLLWVLKGALGLIAAVWNVTRPR